MSKKISLPETPVDKNQLCEWCGECKYNTLSYWELQSKDIDRVRYAGYFSPSCAELAIMARDACDSDDS